jgi:hypothetical protein
LDFALESTWEEEFDREFFNREFSRYGFLTLIERIEKRRIENSRFFDVVLIVLCEVIRK